MRKWTAVVAVVGIIAASCGGGQANEASTEAAAATPSTAASTAPSTAASGGATTVPDTTERCAKQIITPLPNSFSRLIRWVDCMILLCFGKNEPLATTET